jgi:hypothetical protein
VGVVLILVQLIRVLILVQLIRVLPALRIVLGSARVISGLRVLAAVPSEHPARS